MILTHSLGLQTFLNPSEMLTFFQTFSLTKPCLQVLAESVTILGRGRRGEEGEE